ncbi:MAG: nitroreductase [Alphaproteobacteria bacterium]|jgi:nitroreductase
MDGAPPAGKADSGHVVLDALLRRASTPPRLMDEPAPDDAALAQMFAAATRVPDHAALRPWRFHVIRGDARFALGELFVEALRRRSPNPEARDEVKERSRPLRAPLIVAVCAEIVPDNAKAPPVEQIATASAAVQTLILAADALGYGAIWLTGANARDPGVKAAFGLADKDEIVGFVYMGTVTGLGPEKPRPDPADYVCEWTGE